MSNKTGFHLILFVVCFVMMGLGNQITLTLQAELVLDAQTILGEGAIWHPKENKLYWIDIEGKALRIFDPSSNTEKIFPTGSRIGTVVPSEKEKTALIALQDGIYHINTGTGIKTKLVQPLQDSLNLRFNDGKCDPAGRLWVGTLALDNRRKAAVLYRISATQEVDKMLDSVTISNGIVWNAAKNKMFYNDTPTGTVQVFDYDNQSGSISNRRVAIRIPKGMGSPDGMAIDVNDHLWIALWGAGKVGKFDPISGELLQTVTVPAPNVSSCAFGGKDLDILYITTARAWVNKDKLKEFPLSGGLFAVKPGVKGVKAFFYKGKL